MISLTRDGMIEALVEAYPALRPSWVDFQSEWNSEAEPPLYLFLADAVRHLISNLERGETSRFDALFGVLERWLIDGDQYVREAATIGFIEGLQNENLHHRTKPSDLIPWLGPAAKQSWDDVERFWSTGQLIPDHRTMPSDETA